MVWKVHITYGAPKAKIVWDNIFYRTRLTINEEEVKPGEEVAVNIFAEPKIRLSLVAENEGDEGMCWVAIGLRSEGRTVPLFLKQDILKPGDIIVGKVEYTINIDFMDYVEKATGRRDAFSIVGYAGHGDLLTGLSVHGVVLPLAYIRDIETRRIFGANDIDDIFKVIETIVVSGVRMPAVEIFSIQPIEIPQLNIRIRTADAGYNFYRLYKYYGEDFKRSGIKLPIDSDISSFLTTESDDSTEVI